VSVEAQPPSTPRGRASATAAVRPLAGQGQYAAKFARSLYSGRVAAYLRESIIDGTFERGAPLVESRLADVLDVSRGPVRSALQALEAEGLVETGSNGRAVSAGFDAVDLEDVFRVRFELESTAIDWAVQRNADWRPLRAAFEALAAEGASTPQLVELDVSFHREWMELSGSRFLVQAWRAIAPVIQAVITIGNRELTTQNPSSNFNRIIESHRVLCEAVEARDVHAAKSLLRDQFNLTKSMVVPRQVEIDSTAGQGADADPLARVLRGLLPRT
jgi:GntR family transcriptional regulator of gluconate operon